MSGIHRLEPRCTIDFESRSACNLRAHGTWRYSQHPTTEVLCLAFRLPTWEEGEVKLWHPAFDHLGIEEEGMDDLLDLFTWIEDGGVVEAHNAFFERCIWTNLCKGWPEIKAHQWMCSAAKAAAHSLPRGLDDALAALRLPVRKDMEGAEVMKKMVKPRKPVKRDQREWRRKHAPCGLCSGSGRIDSFKRNGEPTKKGTKCYRCEGRGHSMMKPPPMPLLWVESEELMETLWRYNCQDVLAEEALSAALPDLNDFEQRLYCLDQEVNERGFRVDLEAVDAALALIDYEQKDLNGELSIITNGEVTKASQRQKVMVWLEDHGLTLLDTKKETLDAYIDEEEDMLGDVCEAPSPETKRVLEIVRTIGRSSTAKYTAMRDWADLTDSRVKGGLLYHGAGTGRWSGKGVQVQNLPKNGLYIDAD